MQNSRGTPIKIKYKMRIDDIQTFGDLFMFQKPKLFGSNNSPPFLYKLVIN